MSSVDPQNCLFSSRQHISLFLWNICAEIHRVSRFSATPTGSLGLASSCSYLFRNMRKCSFKREYDCRNKCVFCCIGPILLIDRDQQTGRWTKCKSLIGDNVVESMKIIYSVTLCCFRFCTNLQIRT